VQHAPRIVGGFCALLFSRDSSERRLPSAPEEAHEARFGRLTLPATGRLERPCVITAADAVPDCGGPFAAMAPLSEEVGARMLAAVPLAGGEVLVLVERRADRVFDAGDWDLLRTVARQADAAMERVRLFDEVRELSLTDPLTGLANRRHLGLVLDRSMAAGRRGDAVALVMIDLDDFKAVNDSHGHLWGDRLLRAVADALAAEARGSDLVARYGGDEFCVVLPGGNSRSAESLLRRVRRRLHGAVSLSSGVAELSEAIGTADEFLDAADRDLLRSKPRDRTGSAASHVTGSHPTRDPRARTGPEVDARSGDVPGPPTTTRYRG
jgi:diguanylate cyclase (GGDEF)-like protein